MKVIFLDMDGVLNSHRYLYEGPVARGAMREDLESWADMIDPEAVERLNTLVDRTGAKIVLSSSWRVPFMDRMDDFRRMLAGRGFRGEVIGRTPTGRECGAGHTGQRGFEVAMWLRDHPEGDLFVCLDDSGHFAGMMSRLVQTPWSVGLQDEHVERATTLLAS